MPNLAPHFQILTASWRQRRTEKSWGGIIAMAGLLLCTAFLLGYLYGGDSSAMTKAFCISAALFIQVMWMLHILSIYQYNHPAHARLVPGNLRRIRESIIGLWIAVSVICTLVLVPAFGFTGHLFLAIAVMTVLSITPALWIAALAFGVLQPWLSDFGVNQFLRGTARTVYNDWAVALGIVALIVCAWILTHSIIRNGNEKHQKNFEQASRMRWAAMPNAEGRQASLHHWGHWGTRILRVIQYPVTRYMQHLVRNPKNTPSHVMARAELMFGADVHWVMQVSMAAVVTVLTMLACFFARLYWGAEWGAEMFGGLMLLVFAVFFIGLTPPMSLHQAIFRSQREQSLLMLVPGMPQGAHLNRILSVRFLRQTAIAWLTAALIATQLPLKPGFHTLVTAALIGFLPALGLVIQDWSRMQRQRPSRVLVYMMATLAGPVICSVCMFNLQWSAWALLIASAIVTLVLLLWRWNKLQGFPAALPAGRLAAS